MGTREEFAAVLQQRKETNLELQQCHAEDHPLNTEYREAVVAAMKVKKPKSRKLTFDRALKVLTNDELSAIREPFMKRAAEIQDPLLQREKELGKRANELAEDLQVHPGEKRLKLKEYSSTTYSTQGYGAISYAQNNAKIASLEAETHGVKSEVVEVDRGCVKRHWPIHDSSAMKDFQVWVFVEDELDVEILRRKPVSLREHIKACWKHGINPRVMNPYLPYGIEEKLGLDYFGNEKRKGDSP